MNASPATTLRLAAPDEALRPPSRLLLMLEGRLVWEFGALLAAWPWLRRVPRGDGHPVLVFPGMGAGDLTTLPLRRYLASLGYAAQGWGQGINRGPRAGVLERCSADVRALSQRHGQPVSLVGWSLGGLFARELAKALPDHTRSVITLGTPFGGPPRATHAWRLYQWLSGEAAHERARTHQLRVAPAVPTTSIYSRTDGIVAWRCSVNDAAPQVENIEAGGSHCGLGLNPLVLYAVADRLAQPRGAWQPFDASGARRWFFNRNVAHSARAAA